MVHALAMRRLFGTAALLCCALGIGTSMASNDDTVDTINIAGQLGLYSHKFEDGSSVEYCLLTPADQSDEAIMIELDGALHDCHHAAEGVFSVAPHTTSKRNKSGCDERYLPLCVDASFQLKSAVKTNSEKKHEDSSEGEAEGEGGVAGQKAMNKISGARTVLFLELYYLDKSPACTTSCITQNMWGATYSIDGMYNEASYGLLRFSQSASKDIKLSMGTKVSSYNYCASSGTSKIKTDALAKLATTQSSVSASSFNHLVMMTPSLCGVAVSQVGGNLIWINSNIPDALAHELGHNLGRRHASLDTANTDPATRTSFSTDVDYGDKSCVMGYSGIGLRSHSVPNRIRMGWIPTSAVVVPPASTCTSSEIQYTVAASKLAANNAYGRHAIQFPRARGGTYYVSYRSGSGYDVNAPSGWKGAVFLHYTTSPSSRTKFVKALTSGATYTDSLTSTSVRVVSMGTNSATVAVRCGKNLATCTMSFSSSKQSSLSGTFAPVAKIGGYNAWARSDRKVVIGYCAAKTMWVVGAHDGSSTANFVPCNNIIFKSAAQTYYKSPTDVEVWYSKSSSSWPQDTSATFTVTYCASSKHEEEEQLEVIPQEQPAASTNDTATSAASVVSVSVSEDAQAAPVVAALHSKTSEEVCLYFSSLCSKCQMAPTNICSYLTDLCADCHA